MNARRTFHGYAAAIWGPRWITPNLVFKAGLPDHKSASITGGGQIYGHEFQGLFTPLFAWNTPGVVSWTGGGQIPGQPPMLVPLLGGSQGQGS